VKHGSLLLDTEVNVEKKFANLFSCRSRKNITRKGFSVRPFMRALMIMIVGIDSRPKKTP